MKTKDVRPGSTGGSAGYNEPMERHRTARAVLLQVPSGLRPQPACLVGEGDWWLARVG